MTGNEYQALAERTINPELTDVGLLLHAMFGLSSEAGELCGIFQKHLQGHDLCPHHVKKEIGDVMWFVAELCTALDFELDDILEANIEKLRKRYPNGFEEERSVHRKEGDI